MAGLDQKNFNGQKFRRRTGGARKACGARTFQFGNVGAATVENLERAMI
jgi:hypothetical protein